jgi:hypothetical protein
MPCRQLSICCIQMVAVAVADAGPTVRSAKPTASRAPASMMALALRVRGRARRCSRAADVPMPTPSCAISPLVASDAQRASDRSDFTRCGPNFVECLLLLVPVKVLSVEIPADARAYTYR